MKDVALVMEIENVTKQKKKNNMIKATLEVNRKEYEGSGENIIEAIGNLPITMIEAKTKGRITIQEGDREVYRDLVLKKVRRMLGSKFGKILMAKDLGVLLNR